jgi:hypothetical protein
MALGTIPLCTSHLLTLKRELKMSRKAGSKAAFENLVDNRNLQSQERKDSALVYFISAGRRIKIGQSLNPARRLASIRGGYSVQVPKGLNTANAKLLATEPGGRGREYELHQQFAHLRVHGEWFDNAVELKDYISELNQLAW